MVRVLWLTCIVNSSTIKHKTSEVFRVYLDTSIVQGRSRLTATQNARVSSHRSLLYSP